MKGMKDFSTAISDLYGLILNDSLWMWYYKYLSVVNKSVILL